MQAQNIGGTKIIFFGTPDFAVPSLKQLIDFKANIIGVVTQPPKPVGRKAIITPSPIQKLARQKGLSVMAPTRLKEPTFLKWFKEQGPDLAILVAYGKILPMEILSIPRLGFINVHPSLLPRHRGPAPVVNTILSGDKFAGVTIMKLDTLMDHGPILAQQSFPLDQKITSDKLTPLLATAGAQLLVKILPAYVSGTLIPQAQDDTRATVHHLLKKSDGQINWQNTSTLIERQVRAFTPWPGTYSCLEKTRLKILEVSLEQNTDSIKTSYKPGQLIIKEDKIYVGTGSGLINVSKLQLAGHKAQKALEFVNGHPGLEGTILSACPKQ